MSHEITAIAVSLIAEANASNHRRMLVLSGEPQWCHQEALSTLNSISYESVIWFSDQAPEGVISVHGEQGVKVLGSEFEAIVFDAYNGFDPDSFGAVVGTLRGGGLLILLTPPLESWPRSADPDNDRYGEFNNLVNNISGRFLSRFIRVMQSAAGVCIVAQGSPLVRPIQNRVKTPAAPLAKEEYRTDDQRCAVTAIKNVVSGHRRRPLVLTSDRGRGKSAALGIAAAQLLRRGMKSIIVTAPRLTACAMVFEHAQRLLPDASAARGVLRLDNATLIFVPPDDLFLNPQSADLLLVDEAAGIPAAVLARLLKQYSRIVFASTIHGYEGTGRGFALRFEQVLSQRTPGWQALRLETPIRWAPEDPLEHFVHKALLLDAAAAADTTVREAPLAECNTERIDRDALLNDEGLLAELFGLLVLAHYRTRPRDLKSLLDGANLSVYVTRYEGHVVATALVAREGGFDAETAKAVYEGRRRPKGHLLPQSLAAHVGLEKAPQLRCARVIRIAVHPALQRRGLGTTLLKEIGQDARKAGCDYMGACFGATDEVLRFWRRAHFLPVRLGFTREHTSGCYSAVVLHSLSNEGKAIATAARHRFLSHFPHMLSDSLRYLEPAIAATLLQRTEVSQTTPSYPLMNANDWRDITTFAFALRGYEVTVASLWQLVCMAMADPQYTDLLNTVQRDVLITKVLQKRSWQEVATVIKVPGRNAVIDTLRHAVKVLVKHYGEGS